MTLFLLLSAAALGVSVASAGIKTAVRVTNTSAPAPNNAFWSAVASSPKTGKSMVVYWDESTGGYPAYKAQLLDTSGNVEGTAATLAENTVSSSTLIGTYHWPGVAYNPVTGGWLACWKQFEPNPDSAYCQHLAADGSKTGSVIDLGGINNQDYTNVNPVWSTARKQFLVEFTAWSNGNEPVQARWVNPSGGTDGPLLTLFDPTTSSLDTYGNGNMAYSTKSDTFLVALRMGVPDSVYLLLVDGQGAPIGAPIGPLTSTTAGWSPSVAYNESRDEFVVAWFPNYDGYPLAVQRVTASDGTLVGGEPVLNPIDNTLVSDGTRARAIVTANPFADELLVTMHLLTLDPFVDQIYAAELSGDGTLATPVAFPGQGTLSMHQRTTFNPKTCEYLTVFRSINEPIADLQLWSGRYTSPAGCKSSGGKPSLKGAGTPGGTSLRVKVGCAGGGTCSIRLGGRLVGGSGKLQGRKVRVDGKKTVTLRYTNALIDQLASDGGGRIRVKAKQIGGGSKTITLTVPASVTG